MRICVYGAGAVGGVFAVRLARAGHEVALVARGAQLAVVRERGCVLEMAGERLAARVAASADPAALGSQDYVLIAVKAPALPAVMASLGPLLGPQTAIVPAMNGIPWWFFDGFGPKGVRLGSVDPDGALAAAAPPGRTIGCVLHLGATVAEPGLWRHFGEKRVYLGAPDGTMSPRVERLAALLRAAGFDAAATPDIRREIWHKLLGNFNFGPISVLAGATIREMIDDAGARRLLTATMEEGVAVGRAFGLEPASSVAERIEVTRALGDFKTSMLQDFEKGRAMEIDAIVTAVAEMARIAGQHTPAIDAMLALVALKARLAGLYDGEAGRFAAVG